MGRATTEDCKYLLVSGLHVPGFSSGQLLSTGNYEKVLSIGLLRLLRVNLRHVRRFLVRSREEDPTIILPRCFSDCCDVLKQPCDCSTGNRIAKPKPACFTLRPRENRCRNSPSPDNSDGEMPKRGGIKFSLMATSIGARRGAAFCTIRDRHAVHSF